MRERANRQKPLLGQTLVGLETMQDWLQSLYQDEYPRNQQMFALLAQGPLEQMRDLLDDLEWLMEDMIPLHLREAAAESTQPPHAEAAWQDAA